MQIAVDIHLMGGKITADEEIGTLLAIGNDQFIAHITVTVVVSRLMANEDVAGAVVFRPSPKPKSGIPLTGRIVSKGRCTQPGVIFATGVTVEGMGTAGGVVIARGVELEDSGTAGGVGMARGVFVEGTGTTGGVVIARGVAVQGIGTAGGVAIARGVAVQGT